jgi:hypothetical protein
VAAHFAAAAMDPFEGFGAFNIRGQTLEIPAFLALIAGAATQLGMTADLEVAADAIPALFVCDLDDSAIQAAFPNVGRTALVDGIKKTLEAFRAMAGEGRLTLVR